MEIISPSCSIRKWMALALAASLAAAGSAAGETILRLQGQAVTSSADPLGLGDDLDTGVGVYLGAEFRLGERYGVEVGVSRTELEQSATLDLFLFSVDTTAELTVTPLTVAFNIHLTPGSRYDFYLAPKIGWAFFDDLEIRTDADFSGLGFPGFPIFGGLTVIPTEPVRTSSQLGVEDQFLFGLRLGFDVPFGEGGWRFTSAIDYTDLELELDLVEGASVGLDPLQIGVGVGWAF